MYLFGSTIDWLWIIARVNNWVAENPWLSASFEDGLISNDWKRETAKEFMINGVAAKEKSMRPYQKFEILKEKAQMQVIPVSILTELAEESTGNLVETIQNYTVNQLSITSGNQYRVYVQKES